MARADCVLSTPPTNTSAITPTSRRGFLAQAAGVAAGGSVLALATIPPAAAAGPSALVLDGTKINQELRDLVQALQDADEALTTAEAAYDADSALYEGWLKRNPERTGNNRRAHRKWDGRLKAYMRGSNLFSTQAAYEDARRAHREVRKSIAEYRARDMNELAHIACLVFVYEDGKPGYGKPIMAVGVALDVALMGINGGLSA
jgi:hypothetical protein